MNLSRTFILRPVATTLLMIALLLFGAVAYTLLPVSALPQVDYPTMQVVTLYPGASPEVMASSVTAPLERQFGQVPGLEQLTSTSSGGSSVITLRFNLKLEIDVAEQQVQQAINLAQPFLPRDLPNPPIYSKTNPADAPILTLALTSETLPLSRVHDFADTRLAQKISQVPGVGLVSISGGQKPAVRIQINPTALSATGLNLEQIRSVITTANVNQAKGNFDGPRRAYQIGANDQLLVSQDYANLVIAYREGAPVRLSDVAEVIDDAENSRQAAWVDETRAVILNIQRQPGANIIAVVDRIKELLPSIRETLPASIKVEILSDRTLTIRSSVAAVQFELMLTIALVVMVIFLFLRNFAATVIPSVAVPLSLIGTFAVMHLLGYSLNNLSLMALTISAGFVVDDAIVMIENISRYVEEGESPLQAALKGAEQIAFTIVSLTVSLIAVLIPLLLMGDIVGRLFREFAVTLSVAILVSGVVSLIDPHGDVADELLDHFPRSRTPDLVYFDPAAADFPIAFNPLANVPPDQRPLVTAGLVSAFKSIWAESWGARLEYILGFTIAALLEAENTSLLCINRMLSDEEYRAGIVEQVRDPFIRAFWTDEFANYEKRYQREAIGPVQNKIGQFARSPLLRNIIGQVGNKLDFRHIIDTDRVFIANLAKGRLGPEPANLLGALLVAQFKHAAMTRADVPEYKRRVFHLVLDEFHNFTTASIAEALSEARKYGLSLMLAHQFIDQLSDEIRPAVFGNVGTIISFRVGNADAAHMAGEFGQAFTAEQFCDLQKHEIFVRMLENGQPRAPFRGFTYPPILSPTERKEILIRHSRQKYTTPREKVERRLRDWMRKRPDTHS